ncbi:MAG: Hsp70 family protein [Clostridia bacterium]|nr:Hsp70 family protein [Clostridia bacterium]
MKINVGIDLGTTYSAVATFSKQLGRVQVFKNNDEKECTPSVICREENGYTMIGEAAKIEQKSGNLNTVAFYKSKMGDKNFSAYIGGQDYTAEDLSAIFLTEFVKEIEEKNNIEIDGAVITVPAYFNEEQRKATIRAGERAGLKVLKIINEPTAAIIAYGLTSGKEKNVMVYDLGGGTFDITIAHVKNTEIEVLATNGNHQLGGMDWDEVLLNNIATQFSDEHGIDIADYPEEYKELQVKCEEAKKRLSAVAATTISIQCDGCSGKYEVTREYFDSNTSNLLESTKLLIHKCFDEITEARNGKRFDWKDIDEVVLVGGSTRMPQIKDMIVSEYGKPPITKDINVDTIVATGAAMQAELCVNSTLTLTVAAPAGGNAGGMSTPMTLTISNTGIKDITAHSLGMLALASNEKDYINSIIIPKNSPVSKTFSRQYTFGGEKMEVFIMQGETRDPHGCDILGKYVITGMPKGQKNQLSVNFLYNANGVVEANANLGNGTMLTAVREEVTESLDEIIARLEREKKEAEEAARRAQSIEIMLMIDSSGSMDGNRIYEAKKAAKSFAREFDLKYAKISILSFGDRSTFTCKNANSLFTIDAGIDAVTVGGVGYGTSNTPINNNYRNFSGKGTRILVVLTDGYWENQVSEEYAADNAKADGILIYGIGIGDADEAFLDRISSGKGKKVDLSQLTTAFKEVASSIATEVASGNSLR